MSYSLREMPIIFPSDLKVITYHFLIFLIKKVGVQRTPTFFYPKIKITNYAATAGATRATGRDSPAARSRGKL